MSINFVRMSSDDNRIERKKNLESKLEQAKIEYEAVKRKRQLEDQRGDSKWILPSLEKRIDENIQLKKKHKKKHKKHKKEEEVEEWEEADPKGVTVDQTCETGDQASTTVDHASKTSDDKYPCTESKLGNTASPQMQSFPKREEWMLTSSLLEKAMLSSSHRENKTKTSKIEKRKKEEEERKSAYSSRELNPYWKDGGVGLPLEANKNQETKKKNSFSDVGVGDGGKSWIQKAYERSKLQAEEEGIPFEDVVAQRWGSMAKLNALLKASENSSRNKQESKHTSSSSSSGWRKSKDQSNQSYSLLVSNNVSTSTKTCKDDKSCEQKTFDNKKTSFDNKKTSFDDKKKSFEPLKEDYKNDIITKDKLSNKVESNTNESILPTRIPLTDKEKNEISAKILRAELMGNTALCAKLKLDLQQGRIISTVNKSEKISTSTEDVLLTREDKHGNLYPLKLQHGAEELNRKRNKKKLVSMHDSEGNRVKYFEDDDCTSLKTMVENERLTTADEQHAMMHRMASKHLGSTMGDDYTVDDMFVTASAIKGTTASEDKRTKTKAVAAHQLREKQLSSCRYCFENPKIAKHLIVAIGVTTYLALPINASLTDGHCLIIPMQHIIGQSFMDEDVQQEVKDEDVLFIESCKNIHHQNHCIIECIPVPKEVGEMAPIYFKKAITESESEWSQNKKIVTITAIGGISKAIPKGLSYFAVEFGLDGGFGHVIEDERLFPSNFGKEIIGGIMDLDVRLWRNPPKENFDQHKHKVLRFSEQWKPYDWTQDIKS